MRNEAARCAMIAVALTALLAPAAVAQKWHHGLGTGFFGLNTSGDMAFTTDDGPVELDASMSASDLGDITDSAFGLGGYSTNGKWFLQYSFGQLKLEDSVTGTETFDLDPVRATVKFDTTGAEFVAARRFALRGKHAWSFLFGARYTRHEVDFGLAIDHDPPNPPLAFSFDIDESWTDGVIGLMHGAQLNAKWSWSNRLDAAYGGSEGTYFFKTSSNWQWARHWATSFYGQGTSIEYENDKKGDPDHYLYDAEEYGVGVTLLVTW